MASRSSRILVVNPNSNEAVTRGLREALARLAFEGGPLIECRTLVEGRHLNKPCGRLQTTGQRVRAENTTGPVRGRPRLSTT